MLAKLYGLEQNQQDPRNGSYWLLDPKAKKSLLSVKLKKFLAK